MRDPGERVRLSSTDICGNSNKIIGEFVSMLKIWQKRSDLYNDCEKQMANKWMQKRWQM